MSNTMKAQMFYAPHDVRFETVNIPAPSENEVLVKIHNALTCGTDLKTYRRGHPTMLQKIPSPFGHEFSGEILETGKEVKKFHKGDRIVAANSAPCFECFYCKRNRYSLCLDLHYLNGAYAEYIIIPERIVRINTYKIPDNVSSEEASLLEPLSCVVHGVDRLQCGVGDVVVVVGAGPIGSMFTYLLTLRGARVICVDLSEYRLRQSNTFGSWRTVHAGTEHYIDEIKNLSHEGRGVDAVVEATGFPVAWENALSMVRPGGEVLLFGGTKNDTKFSIDCQKFHYEEQSVKAVYHHTPFHVKKAFELLVNQNIEGKRFFSGEYPLEKTIDALESISRQEGIKYIIRMN